MRVAANDLILSVAVQDLGIRRIRGPKDDPRIVEWLRGVGVLRGGDEQAYCSAWLNSVFDSIDGVEGSGSAAARSWLRVGEFVPIEEAQPGDIVVLWRVHPTRSWKGHVGIYLREEGDKVVLLGGNQNGRVGFGAYSKRRILGVRRHELACD